jgi:general secretion pathway protein I
MDPKEGGGLGALAAMFGGGKPPAGAPPPPPGDPRAGILGAMGPAAGLAQAQFQQLVDTLTKSVREVHLTVTWKEGKLTESFDIVTHVVSLGPGSDRNGGAAAAMGSAAAGASGDQFVRMDTGAPVPNPAAAPDGSGMVDPRDGMRLVPASQWAQMRGGGLQQVPGLAPGQLNPMQLRQNNMLTPAFGGPRQKAFPE